MRIEFKRDDILNDNRVRCCEACGLKAFFYFDMYDISNHNKPTWIGFTYVCKDNKCFEYLKLLKC